jgi:hypothetical protein
MRVQFKVANVPICKCEICKFANVRMLRTTFLFFFPLITDENFYVLGCTATIAFVASHSCTFSNTIEQIRKPSIILQLDIRKTFDQFKLLHQVTLPSQSRISLAHFHIGILSTCVHFLIGTLAYCHIIKFVFPHRHIVTFAFVH